MATQSNRIEGNLHVAGSLTAEQLVPSTGSVTDNSVQAGTNVAATKLEHQHQVTVPLTAHAEDATARRVVAHRVRGETGSVVAFGAASTVIATSTGQAVINLRKNGTTILTSTITLDSANVAFTLEDAAGFTSTALAAGDVLEVSIDSVSGSTVPKGVFASLVIREKAD